MTQSPSLASPAPPKRTGRFGATAAAFVLGLPLGAGIIALVYGPLRDTVAHRYLSHEVECVEVVMFCVALGGLVGKLFGQFAERAAFRAGLLPPWNGQPVPVADAGGLLGAVDAKPRRVQATYLGRRVAAVLEFVRDRNSAAELDDQLRTLADNDAVALEGSYALIRFITWAIPILGFLGTVLGITQSISSLTPEQMEKDLGAVTSGLALAFDATALGLGLTMIVMFVTYAVDRVEQTMMLAVDQYADRQLAHRFERPAGATNEFIDATRRSTQVLTEAVEKLVEKQAAVWAKSFDEVAARRDAAEQQASQRLTAGVEQALDRTLAAHEKRLAHAEQQAAAHTGQIVERLGTLSKLADVLARQAETLARVQDGERQLVRLQEELEKNLEALAGAGDFQRAVHSLTAAIHLITAHAPRPEGRNRPGAAA